MSRTNKDMSRYIHNFLQSIIIPIKKKPNATACEDHRTISLLTHVSKVMIRILTKRVQAKTEAIGGLGDDQFGFRKGMGTRDAIGTLRGVYRMVRMYIV